MKKINSSLIVALVAAVTLLLTGCEDVIDLKTATGPESLVVDGWITNQPGAQKIRLTRSTSYFNNSPAPAALEAEVRVADDLGNTYHFLDAEGKGDYRWIPANPDSVMGSVGRKYTLHIQYDGEVYTAENEMRRVPEIDSLVYTAETLPFKPDKGPKSGYIAEFYARDFPGTGDCYWIKPLRDGALYKSNPVYISIAYDAAYGAESATDGLIFIQPLRQSLTIGELFEDGDRVGVELLSITPETFHFLKQIRTEASNGGLLAVPSSNIPTNLKHAGGKRALGFFGVSAVSRLEGTVDAQTARPEQ